MDEVTFGDVLMHYQNRLQSASDQIQNIRSQLTQAMLLVESSWKGMAADSCRDKLNVFHQEMTRADNEIADAMTQLGAIVSDMESE